MFYWFNSPINQPRWTFAFDYDGRQAACLDVRLVLSMLVSRRRVADVVQLALDEHCSPARWQHIIAMYIQECTNSARFASGDYEVYTALKLFLVNYAKLIPTAIMLSKL